MMKKYIVVYFNSSNKYGNKYYRAFSKEGVFELFKSEDKESVIINIIEL